MIPDKDVFRKSDIAGKFELTRALNSHAVGFIAKDLIGESEVAQKPGMTGNSDIMKGSTEEIDIETLRRKVQEMKRKKGPRMEIRVCTAKDTQGPTGNERTEGRGKAQRTQAEERQRSPTRRCNQRSSRMC